MVVFERKAKLAFNPTIFEKQTKNGRQGPIKQLVNSELARVIV